MHLPLTSRVLVLAALSLAGSVASASPVTYDFTGTINSEFGIFRNTFTANEQVSGSFTIDIDAAIPGQQQSGTTDSTYWVRNAYGGTAENLPVPAALVFTETVTVGGVTYSLGSLSPTLDSSTIIGNGSTGNALGGTASIRSPDSSTQNEFQLLLDSNSTVFAAYLSNGLPNLDDIAFTDQSNVLPSQSLFQAYTNAGATETGQFGFYLTSVTAASPIPPGGTPVPLPTPLPAAAWLLLSGMALLRTLSGKVM